MISTLTSKINVLTTTALLLASDNEGQCGPRLTASDSGHSGANQEHHWDRNSTAHTPGPLTPSAVAQNGGDPARGGGARHGRKTKCKNSSGAVQ